MPAKYEFGVQTEVSNVADPTLPQDAATKNYVDSRSASVFWDTTNASPFGTIAVVATSGSASITFGGNVTTSLPANQRFVLSGDATLYTATSATFNGTNTIVAITPNLNNSATLTTTGSAVTRIQVNDLAGTNISAVIANGRAVLTAAGGTPTLVEPSWRTVTTVGNTITVSDNPQDPRFVFRSNGGYSATASIFIASTAEPVAGSGAILQLIATNGNLVGINSALGVAIPSGQTLSQALASSTFISTFFGANPLWTATFSAPSTVTLAYAGVVNPVNDANPADIELDFTGTWTNSPNAASFATANITTNLQAPNFGLLTSNHIIPAVTGTPSDSQTIAYDAPNNRLKWQTGAGGIQSINTQTGPAINVNAGTGIGISTANNTITVTNTGSGSIASGNFTSFNAVVQRSGQNTQMFAPTAFIANSSLDQAGVYIDICGGGWLNETNTLLDGGAIGNTTYITTATRTGTNGLIFPVSTTYGEVECQLFSQNLTLNVTYNSAGGTLGSVRVEAYFALRGLNASSSQAPYQSSAVFPPFSFPSDGVTFLYVFQPVYTFVNTGTGSATLTIPAAQFRAISPQYTGLGGTNEYIPYLRVLLFNTAANPAPLLPTSASVTAYSALPSMRVLMTLPGVGGATPTIQQVLNTGNSATNTTGNVSTIILNDSVSGSATTLDGTKVESRVLRLDGSTSGNVQLRANATTTSYSLTLPATQGANNQTLINNGSGVLSWGAVGNPLPLDCIGWRTSSGNYVATDTTTALVIVQAQFNASLTAITFTSGLPAGYVAGDEIIASNIIGTVSGRYVATGTPTIYGMDLLVADRSTAWNSTTVYTFSVRRGNRGFANMPIDTAGIGTAVSVGELGLSGSTLVADGANPGRYVLTSTLNSVLGADNRTGGRNLIISQADQLRFQDTTQPTPFFIGLRAPASALTANANFILPSVVPASTLPLVSDSAGNWSFSNTLALTTVSVANAPVNSTDVARLAEVQAATSGLKPITGVNTWIAETLIAGSYTNPGGTLGGGQWTGTTQLTIAGGTPAVGDTVVFVNQSGVLANGAVGNGSFTVITNTATSYQLNRLAVPAFGNFYLALSGSNAGSQWQNVTTGTITATTPIVFAQFGLPNSATPNLGQVLTAGKITTNAQATGLTWGSDNTVPVKYQNSGSGGLALTWSGTTPAQIFANNSGVFNINAVNTLIYPTNALDGLFISNNTIKRNATGDLIIAGGTGATDGVVLGQNTNTVRINGTATAGTPSITAQGDANTSLAIVPSGLGKVIIGNSTLSQLNIDGSAAATLRLQSFSANTNAVLQIQGKGSSPALSQVQLCTSFPNYWSFIGATTPGTGNPTIIAQPSGLGTTQNIQLAGLGNGNVLLGGLASNCGISINGGNSTQAVVVAQSATATNCDLVLQGLGTGTVNASLALNSGTSALPAYTAPLLAANALTSPSAITAGTTGQFLVSRGSGNSPAWVGPGGYFEGSYTTSTVIVGNADTILNWANVSNNLSALSYSNGVFTANRACTVMFAFQIVFTSAPGSSESDVWFTKNGVAGTRFGQTNFSFASTTTEAGSFILTTNWPFRLATNDTIRMYCWTSSSSTTINIGNSAFGGVNSRCSVVELTF